jgi:hypothetical protein
MSTHHVKVALGMTVIVAAVAYLLLSGTTANTLYFLTVPEVAQQLSALQQASRPIRVAGQVTADPIHWEARGTVMRPAVRPGHKSPAPGKKACVPASVLWDLAVSEVHVRQEKRGSSARGTHDRVRVVTAS